jgi:putative SOS response-associated peptidase YedK
MCGRFTQAYTWRELVALYRLTQPAVNLQPRYNIAPTTTIDVVIPRGANPVHRNRLRRSRRDNHFCQILSIQGHGERARPKGTDLEDLSSQP